MLVHESPAARKLRLEFCDEHEPARADLVLPQYLNRLRTDLRDNYEQYPSVNLAAFWRAQEDAHGANPSYNIYRLTCHYFDDTLHRRALDAHDHVVALYDDLARGGPSSSERKELQAQLARLMQSYKGAVELYAGLMSTRMIRDFIRMDERDGTPLPVDKVALAVYKAELARRRPERSEETFSLGGRRPASSGLMGRRGERIYFG
ncbi:hypothetical protein JCM3775_006826 [Rhodotorula graminis]